MGWTWSCGTIGCILKGEVRVEAEDSWQQTVMDGWMEME